MMRILSIYDYLSVYINALKYKALRTKAKDEISPRGGSNPSSPTIFSLFLVFFLRRKGSEQIFGA